MQIQCTRLRTYGQLNNKMEKKNDQHSGEVVNAYLSDLKTALEPYQTILVLSSAKYLTE